MHQNVVVDSHRVENPLDIIHLFGTKHHIGRHFLARSGQEIEKDVGIVKFLKEEKVLFGLSQIGNSEDLEAVNGSLR